MLEALSVASLSMAHPNSYVNQDTNGTEDELTIRNPNGEPMASITFWGSDEGSRSRAHADCKLILEALNAFAGSRSHGAA